MGFTMNKNQAEHITFEALFRQAIIDDFDEELDSVVARQDLSKLYSFSERFEEKMEIIFKKAQRKVFLENAIYYSKKIASIFIIVLGLLFSTLLFNTEVRASVGKVLVEWYTKFTSFTIKSEDRIIDEKDWRLGYLPDGYEEREYEKVGRVTNIDFINKDDDIIRFSYLPEGGNTKISVDNENHHIERSTILGNEAFIMTSEDDGIENGIIWNMENYTFSLWGNLPINELKKIAESIVEK